MHLAHLLVQGVDVWMNLPRVPMEASGTSGMKAALNGVPHLSTIDGWWEEGYEGNNGWAIPAAVDSDDATGTVERLYTLLEQEVVPRFYDRDPKDLPRRWILTLKSTPRAPSIVMSSSWLEMACSAAFFARSSPVPRPTAINAAPPSDMIVRTSAKSRLIKPGIVINSEIP